jgi:hypothetical protein
MKIIISLLTFIVFSIYTYAQNDTSEVMQLTIPKGFTKLTGEQFKEFNSRGNRKIRASADQANRAFQKDGIFLYYRNLFASDYEKRLDLETQQKQTKGLIRRFFPTAVIDTSYIALINNIRFLITGYHESEYYYLSFVSDCDTKNRYLHGRVEFQKPDEEEAKKVLLTFLQSMQFKNK